MWKERTTSVAQSRLRSTYGRPHRRLNIMHPPIKSPPLKDSTGGPFHKAVNVTFASVSSGVRFGVAIARVFLARLVESDQCLAASRPPNRRRERTGDLVESVPDPD